MGDNYVSLIPTDPTWQPTRQAAAEAETYVRRVFADPDGMQEITVEFHDRITAVDAGENIERIVCPRCEGEIPLEWYSDLIEQTEGEFDSLLVTVPCCATEVGLDALLFEWPSGFARFEIAILNPARAEGECNAEEIATVAAALGHPVRQILIHL
ncbi:MAG: hypothetical protein HKP61_02965 [Dactylosporangium sp.]|nr:hypothetical protein [Dactylosporangium sp.]